MKTQLRLPFSGRRLPARPGGSTLRLAGLLMVLTFFLSGCYFTLGAARYMERTGGVPWWCQGSPDLTTAECQLFSAYLDFATRFAFDRWTYQDGTNAGGVPSVANARVQLFGAASSFNPMAPNLIEYESTAPGARAISVGWRITDPAGPPAGFAGPRDVWIADPTLADTWVLQTWILRGYENQPDVFAATHPCQASLPLTSSADACYLASHPIPLEVMVTKDDGYDAPGIDAIVEGLRVLPGVNVSVVAPLEPRSGSGGSQTPGGAPGADTDKFTLSGYPVLAAVDGFPADASIWGLGTLSLSPDLVVSGINSVQNLADIGSNSSGTIGAARAASRRFANAVATSQGIGFPPDYPAGVAATLAFFEQWRIGAAGTPYMDVPNINIPTCTVGSIRGTVE
ncbi:MAG: 5'/3'-nucleotidase SurE, partial [Halioglobus sp.]|nr:5'/3'-nucleotidase SurE [Halioglobus sp.]